LKCPFWQDLDVEARGMENWIKYWCVFAKIGRDVYTIRFKAWVANYIYSFVCCVVSIFAFTSKLWPFQVLCLVQSIILLIFDWSIFVVCNAMGDAFESQWDLCVGYNNEILKLLTIGLGHLLVRVEIKGSKVACMAQ